MPLIRRLDAWIQGMGLAYDHPAWLYLWAFLGILALPLIALILLVALFYEITIHLDRGRWVPDAVHWVVATGFALLLVGALLVTATVWWGSL
jgi:hypothetical protein